jgi:hypothetical protein
MRCCATAIDRGNAYRCSCHRSIAPLHRREIQACVQNVVGKGGFQYRRIFLPISSQSSALTIT